MQYINLIDKISDKDKERLINYIDCYGVGKQYFVGLDDWLANWSHANQKLFKLLGEELIREFDFSYTMDTDILYEQIKKLWTDSPFIDSFIQFANKTVMSADYIDKDSSQGFIKLCSPDIFKIDKVTVSIKIKKPGCNKILQISPGMKPMRAFQKIVEYFKDIYTFTDFEEFRLAHSRILNSKEMKGKLCLSIHPLDFITMSDNASNWTSCMNWVHSGCYSAGTVEMMNSNLVLCCYLKSDKNFNFLPDLKKYPGFVSNGDNSCYEWNDKKWRQLFYVTSDIIMGGKAYPYQKESFTKTILSHLKRLAKENLNWTYQFGPELYKDMIHINGIGEIRNNQDWIYYKETTKHNIIWNTNKMYNDMLNDNYTDYWCYRNKVKSNKMINVSGKCNCLKCNSDKLFTSINFGNDYNDRFEDVESVLCSSCLQQFRCDTCFEKNVHGLFIQGIMQNGENTCKKICYNCIKDYGRYCPTCGKPTWFDRETPLAEYVYYPLTSIDLKKCDETFLFQIIDCYGYRDEYTSDMLKEKIAAIYAHSLDDIHANHNKVNMFLLHMCKDCREKLKTKSSIIKMIKPYGYSTQSYYIVPQDFDYLKFCYLDLKPIEPKPNEKIYFKSF